MKVENHNALSSLQIFYFLIWWGIQILKLYTTDRRHERVTLCWHPLSFRPPFTSAVYFITFCVDFWAPCSMFYTENETSVTMQQQTPNGSYTQSNTGTNWEENDDSVPSISPWKSSVWTKKDEKITSGAWGCQSLLFLEALGSSISALCCLLGAPMPWCQSGSLWCNPAPFTCGCCFHPVPRGKWCVCAMFWWSFCLVLKACVTRCLCYKRQVGWRAGWFLEMLWLIVQIGSARMIIITVFLSGVRAGNVARIWHKSSWCFCCSNTPTSLVVTPTPVALLLNHAKLFCVWPLTCQTASIFSFSFFKFISV